MKKLILILGLILCITFVSAADYTIEFPDTVTTSDPFTITHTFTSLNVSEQVAIGMRMDERLIFEWQANTDENEDLVSFEDNQSKWVLTAVEDNIELTLTFDAPTEEGKYDFEAITIFPPGNHERKTWSMVVEGVTPPVEEPQEDQPEIVEDDVSQDGDAENITGEFEIVVPPEEKLSFNWKIGFLILLLFVVGTLLYLSRAKKGESEQDNN